MRSLSVIVLVVCLVLVTETKHLVSYSHTYPQYNKSRLTSEACLERGVTCSSCTGLDGGCGWCPETQTCQHQEDCQVRTGGQGDRDMVGPL